MHHPTDAHFNQLVRIFRYLKGTHSHGLPLSPSPTTGLLVYSDSDWAGDISDRKSTSGYYVFLGNSLIAWRVQKQRAVARSSAEAEYRALALATTELIWLRRLLQEFGFPCTTPSTLYCDNLSALAIASNPILHAQTKHIEIDQHFVREHIRNRELVLQHISSFDQVADILTKPLQMPGFQRLCSKLTITDVPRYLEGGS